jgi:ATP-dependent Clp protease ATP-binding subunit ClpC
MFGNFKEETREVLMEAKKQKLELRHPYVGSEHLLLAILKGDNEVSKKLKEYNLTYDLFKEKLVEIVGYGNEDNEWFLYTPLLKRVIENAILDSKETTGSVGINHLFSSLLEEGEGIAIRILISLNIDLDELYSEFRNRFTGEKSKRKKKLILEDLGIDLTKKALDGEIDPVIGRDKEIKRVLEILCRRCKNNPILIGEAGVGKTAIVEELSRLIAIGEVPIALKNKRIISVSMSSLVSGTKYRGEFEERMSKVLKEVEEDENIILFIDEIHTLVGAGGAEGAIDASNIFKPALARGKLRCIGATTTSEYKKFIEKDSALERRFQKIMVEVPNRNELYNILLNLKGIYEGYHHVIIKDEIINTILDMSEKYIYDRHEPDKSIDILDEVCSKVHICDNKEVKKLNDLKKEYDILKKKKNKFIHEGNFEEATKIKTKENKIMNDINLCELNLYKNSVKEVTKEDVALVIHEKTKIPVYELLNENKKVVESFKKMLNEKVIGQSDACKELTRIFKKIKMGFADSKCYSLLLMGPTGVGKTMMSKLFAENLVRENVIKLDMSEYSESSSISKIIGANPGYVGYDEHKNILEEIRNHPYSVIILDEVEKAHPKVLNLFYQIFEDGKIKDSSNNIVRFDQCIIIMTSNIGFDESNVGFLERKKEYSLSKLNNYFKDSFVNRIDSIIVCNFLKEKDIIFLIHKKVLALKKKYKDKINLTISKKVENEILEFSNYKEYGARKIDKIIKDKVEDIIIDALLEEKEKLSITTLTSKIS